VIAGWRKCKAIPSSVLKASTVAVPPVLQEGAREWAIDSCSFRSRTFFGEQFGQILPDMMPDWSRRSEAMVYLPPRSETVLGCASCIS
jgi:hypothetical protein